MLIAKPTNPRVSTVLLRENALNDMRFLNPCKFDIQTLIPVRESVVVDAELMENRRLKVPDVNRIFHNIIREIVRFIPPFPL